MSPKVTGTDGDVKPETLDRVLRTDDRSPKQSPKVPGTDGDLRDRY